MSRKGSPTGCKSKQVPRIFRSRRATCTSTRVWPQNESCVIAGTSDFIHSSLLTVSQDEDKVADNNKKEKQTSRCTTNLDDTSIKYTDRSWTNCQVINNDNSSVNVDSSIEKNPDVETVSDIEKWLKTRTESVSSIDLESMKSEVVEGVDRYLGDELPHGFLGKDHDGLSIDIDLSDKKLNLGYDPILQDLQSEKLLEACEKDGAFILPEFQLDHLDPLALSPDDMMVAGEILPSTSARSGLSDSHEGVDETSVETERIHEERRLIEEDVTNSCSQATRVIIDDAQHELEAGNEDDEVEHCSEADIVVSEDAVSYIDSLTSNIEDLTNTTVAHENSIIEQLKSKAKIKLEPRIIKKRRKVPSKFEKKQDANAINFGNTQDGVMAVVAISTDKISNTTQIVINTGTEEQIYQGKTSELIEATGNFTKLPKIETSTWNSAIECNVDNTPGNQHEIIISNALEELGITDENLQPMSITEHGKVWVCPREDCTRQFNRLYALKGHLLAHYGIRPFKCDFQGCTWAFYSEFKLKRHKETHLKRKDYVCEVDGCNRRFTTVYNLWSHEKLHSRPNRIVCQVPDCKEKFQTKRALELHMKTHDQTHAPYVCKHEGCGKRYYSSNALTSHQRCHSYKEIDVKCSWPGCGKVFDKPCRLKAHIRSHTGCKPYLCTFQGCQWAFASSSKLKRHQKKHTNERKFVCDVPSCGKAFMRSEHLKEHRLTHKEGRYFQCYICNSRFSAKSSLYVHIKKHQNREETDTSTFDLVNGLKPMRIKDSQCSRVNPVTKLKRKSIDSNMESVCQDIIPEQINPAQKDLAINVKPEEETLAETIANLQQDQLKTLYHCPLETCTKSYTTKATLRTHMLKVHDTPIGDCDKTLNKTSTDSATNMDYILYTASSSMTEPSEQMIMVAPCDAVILSTSPETDRLLPEPEPPPVTGTLKNSELLHQTITHQQTSEQHKKDQGSARTGLTFSDVWNLKANGTVVDSVVGASDVVLGTGDITESLLLTEELPSMYYQDDVVGTEYQVLLLDSGPTESAINLRGLE